MVDFSTTILLYDPIWQPALERSRDYIALSSAFLNANYLGGRRRSLFSNNDIVFDKVVIIFMDFCLVPHKKNPSIYQTKSTSQCLTYNLDRKMSPR